MMKINRQGDLSYKRTLAVKDFFMYAIVNNRILRGFYDPETDYQEYAVLRR